MQIEWSEPATGDLKDLQLYISKDSPHYARQLVERIIRNVARLADFPESGSPCL